MMETKICRICGTEKEITEFEVDNRVKTKRTSRCRQCKHKLDDKAARAYRRLKRRSKLIGAPMEVTPREIRQLFTVFDGHCAYCGKTPESESKLHLEHIVPLSDNGRNTLQNLLPACIHCNSKKGAKPLATHFFENRDQFPDENFNLVVSYISLLSGSKKEEVVAELTDEHISYLIKQKQQTLEKAVASG